MTWTPVCLLEALTPGRGACALLDGRDVAIFRLPDDRVYALDDIDPYSGIAVLSRGIVGSKGDVDVVFSPMHKQAFDLVTGAAIDDAAVRVATYEVRVVGGVVEVLSEVAA